MAGLAAVVRVALPLARLASLPQTFGPAFCCGNDQDTPRGGWRVWWADATVETGGGLRVRVRRRGAVGAVLCYACLLLCGCFVMPACCCAAAHAPAPARMHVLCRPDTANATARVTAAGASIVSCSAPVTSARIWEVHRVLVRVDGAWVRSAVAGGWGAGWCAACCEAVLGCLGVDVGWDRSNL